MTFQAEQVDLAALQQARVRGTMRRMTRNATFYFYRFVFIDERPGLVRVAFEADGIFSGGGAQGPREESAVLVMTIRALHHPFIHAVMEGPLKLLFRFLMAAVAQLGLLFLQQVLGFLGMMRIMAINA
jgi:hypothetical protein